MGEGGTAMTTPVPPGAVRLTLDGDPTAEDTLRAAKHMLRLLREIERNLRASGELPPGPPVKWALDMEMTEEEEPC